MDRVAAILLVAILRGVQIAMVLAVIYLLLTPGDGVSWWAEPNWRNAP